MSDDPGDLDNPPQAARYNYDVGYGKPPMVRRFKESGNPDGRPKGAKNRATIVREVALERHTIIEDGKKQPRRSRTVRSKPVD